jgi:hypothetical protein
MDQQQYLKQQKYNQQLFKATTAAVQEWINNIRNSFINTNCSRQFKNLYLPTVGRL